MVLLGVCSAVAASALFGSVFVPIKRQPTGDGMFAQLMLCVGSLVVSIVIHGVVGWPPLYPLAMIGGAVWCVANAFAIKIMSILGMAMGILIWNTASCLTGWAIARFGLFGISAQEPASNLLNGIGVLFLIMGGSVYLFIKSDLNADGKSDDAEIKKEKIAIDDEKEEEEIPFLRRALAMGSALVSGVCYGSMSTPITYMQQHSAAFNNAPVSGIPYVFSFFSGVIVASTFVFLVYAIKTRRPFVDGAVVVPSLCSGAIFAAAIALFFTAMELLSQTIAYPVCTMMPGLVVSAWSVLYFKEISGRRNLLLLACAYSITLVGVIFVAISKDVVL